MIFADRTEAGRKLADHLAQYANRSDVIVLGAARGGVPVAAEVAAALKVPLDVLVVRKLGVPWNPELAFGALAAGGVRYLDRETIEALGLTGEDIERVTRNELRELQRREQAYRGGRPPSDLAGQTVILVDDGIATGSTMHAAIRALRHAKPARLVLAVPVAPRSTCNRLRHEVNEIVCLDTPDTFFGVGDFYYDFSAVSDEQVTELLDRAAERAHKPVALPAARH